MRLSHRTPILSLASEKKDVVSVAELQFGDLCSQFKIVGDEMACGATHGTAVGYHCVIAAFFERPKISLTYCIHVHNLVVIASVVQLEISETGCARNRTYRKGGQVSQLPGPNPPCTNRSECNGRSPFCGLLLFLWFLRLSCDLSRPSLGMSVFERGSAHWSYLLPFSSVRMRPLMFSNVIERWVFALSVKSPVWPTAFRTGL